MGKSNIIYNIVVISLLLITAAVTAYVFNTRFAKLTVDVWSFFAALFLILEAFYKITSSKDRFWPNQFLRLLRIIIGACIFTIHVLQIIYGI